MKSVVVELKWLKNSCFVQRCCSKANESVSDLSSLYQNTTVQRSWAIPCFFILCRESKEIGAEIYSYEQTCMHTDEPLSKMLNRYISQVLYQVFGWFFSLFLKSFRLSDTVHMLPVFCSPLVHLIFKGHTAYCGVYHYFRNHLIGTKILFYASLTNCVFLKFKNWFFPKFSVLNTELGQFLLV